MKTITMSFAAANEYKPEHPERTARRQAYGSLNFDVIFQEWPNRQSMLKTIEIQDRSEYKSTNWKPCIK